MSPVISIKTVFCCLLVTVLFVGCGKKTVSTGDIAEGMKPEGRLIGQDTDRAEDVTDGDFAEGALESLATTGTPLPPDNMSDEYKQMYGRSTEPLLPVYFGFDSASVESDQFDNLNIDGQYLMTQSTADVVLEGNCDQRGTADYNLALGDLRARNVKKYLVNLGVEPGRMRTVSYGSERPLYPGSDEMSWAGNRRVDLVLQ